MGTDEVIVSTVEDRCGRAVRAIEVEAIGDLAFDGFEAGIRNGLRINTDVGVIRTAMQNPHHQLTRFAGVFRAFESLALRRRQLQISQNGVYVRSLGET